MDEIVRDHVLDYLRKEISKQESELVNLRRTNERLGDLVKQKNKRIEELQEQVNNLKEENKRVDSFANEEAYWKNKYKNELEEEICNLKRNSIKQDQHAKDLENQIDTILHQKFSAEKRIQELETKIEDFHKSSSSISTKVEWRGNSFYLYTGDGDLNVKQVSGEDELILVIDKYNVIHYYPDDLEIKN